jgi:hypothetical protein
MPPWLDSRTPTQQSRTPMHQSVANKQTGIPTIPHAVSAPNQNSNPTSAVPSLGKVAKGYSTPTSSAPPQQISEHVFLGARRGMDFHVLDIEVRDQGDLDFFRALKQSYRVLRGKWRFWFSWWRFNHCEFFKVCHQCFVTPHTILTPMRFVFDQIIVSKVCRKIICTSKSRVPA